MFTQQNTIFVAHQSSGIESDIQKIHQKIETSEIPLPAKNTLQEKYSELRNAIESGNQETVRSSYTDWANEIKQLSLYPTIQNELSQLEKSLSLDSQPVEIPSVNDTQEAIGESLSEAGKELASMPGDMIKEITGEFTKQAKEMGDTMQKGGSMGMLAKLFGYTPSSIAQDLQERYEVKKNGDIGAGFGLVFSKWLAKLFKFDLTGHLDPKIAKEIGVKVKEEPKVDSVKDIPIETNEKTGTGAKYTAIIAGLKSISSDEVKNTKFANIATEYDTIKNANYGELKKWTNTQKSDFITNNKLEGRDRYAVNYICDTLTNPESGIGHIIAQEFTRAHPNKDINSTSFKEVILALGSNIDVVSTFGKIDILDPGASISKIGQTLSMSFDPKKSELSGGLGEQADKLGLSKSLLKAILSDATASFESERNLTTLKGLEGEDQETLKKIATFGESFLSEIVENKEFAFSDQDRVKENIIQEGKVKYLDILRAYILCGGKTKMSERTTTEKLGSYIAFMGILNNDTSTLSGTAGKATQGLMGSSLEVFVGIPEDVQNFAKDYVGKEKIESATKEMAIQTKKSVEAFAENAPLIATAGLMVFSFFPWLNQKTSPFAAIFGKK